MNSDDNHTIPSRKRALETAPRVVPAADAAVSAPPNLNPWALQAYFDGEGDLIKTLTARYPQMPLMSLINLRDEGGSAPRGTAVIATQDGAANVIVEVDAASHTVQFTFGLSSMLALRFQPAAISASGRAAWLDMMLRETGDPAFLWSETRWQDDYILSAATKTYATFFAFSSYHTEAAARLTHDVSSKLLAWLGKYWGLGLG